MPAFDAAGTITAAILSVQLQTRDSFEIVVVDDGSTDETADIVEGLARDDARVRLFRQARSGPAAARNAALRHARAELVTLLDADDLLLPTYLARMDAALELAPQAGFAFNTDAWVLDDATGRIKRPMTGRPKELPADPTHFLRLLLKQNFIFVAATVRRRAIEGIGGWREGLTRRRTTTCGCGCSQQATQAVHV